MVKMLQGSDFYSRFKPVRNRWRHYSSLSILKGILDNLHAPSVDNLVKLRRLPWIQLLMLKWVFLDDQALVSRTAISSKDLYQISDEVYQLSNSAKMPSEYEHFILFMRSIAYQQFPYQRPSDFFGIARQKLLFANVEENHFFRTCFLTGCGFSIDDFLHLSLAILTRFHCEPGYEISRSWFSTLEGAYDSNCIDNFLKSISVDIDELPARLKQTEGGERSALEYFQQTPFVAFPLIRIGQNYWCICPEVLQLCLDHYLFDFFKQVDLQKFNEKFGKQFEGYVKNTLKSALLSFAAESELIKILPNTGKVVDFLVVDGDANVFIDAKGVEMASRGKVAHLREVVKGATNSSLIKAFEQGQETYLRVSQLSNTHPVIQPRTNNYLIAITYKELYISNGLSLSAAIGDDVIEQMQMKIINKSQKPIPLENIYFLSIDEFEGLMALIKAGRISLVEALERAKRSDVDPVNRKFIFNMHLRGWSERDGLPHPLEDVLDPLFETLMEILSHTAQ